MAASWTLLAAGRGFSTVEMQTAAVDLALEAQWEALSWRIVVRKHILKNQIPVCSCMALFPWPCCHPVQYTHSKH